MIIMIMAIMMIMMLEGIRESEDENHDIPLDSVGWLVGYEFENKYCWSSG